MKYSCYLELEGREASQKPSEATPETASLPTPMDLFGRPKITEQDRTRKCLRRVQPFHWVHSGQYRDNMTVAIWCGCRECYFKLVRREQYGKK